MIVTAQLLGLCDASTKVVLHDMPSEGSGFKIMVEYSSYTVIPNLIPLDFGQMNTQEYVIVSIVRKVLFISIEHYLTELCMD